MRELLFFMLVVINSLFVGSLAQAADESADSAFYEKHIRPLLVKHCYECHSEAEQEQQGGLLLDRRSGWLNGGETGKTVVPGEPNASLLIEAVRYENEDLQMPPDGKLSENEIQRLVNWVNRGAPGSLEDLGETEFSQLGDQDALFAKAKTHWAFQQVTQPVPPQVANSEWNQNPVDQFIYSSLQQHQLKPSPAADVPALIRRLSYDLTGLPPTYTEMQSFSTETTQQGDAAITAKVDQLLASPAFGEHFARMWLDVTRYADTDSSYRPDTKTPHYFPFAFTYRDYVIEAFNKDKPYDLFLQEQLAVDLMGYASDAPELAALGFITVGPHANRSATEAIDDWIDLTSRGLLGISVACARCHDHKYEPIPTADYYSLYGVFGSLTRVNALSEKNLPMISGYEISDEDRDDFANKRSAIEAKIKKSGNSKAKGNNLSLAQKIRETELAELLTFHPGASVRTMVVTEKSKPISPSIFIRGEASNRGERVPRRFLKVLDPEQPEFTEENSGRLDLAKKITDPQNPLTPRVFVNRVWGQLMGSYLVETPSDFGLQGNLPSHPELLDWLASDFIANGWSAKHLVRTIVLSKTYQQASSYNEHKTQVDPNNRYLWRANRKHLSIEQIRDGMLSVSGQLDRTSRGHSAPLWGDSYTRRRTIYGFINRFNLDPTLRAFDFPSPMQSGDEREESIVAQQALFAMNSPFVLDQSVALTQSKEFKAMDSDEDRIDSMFKQVLLRQPVPAEVGRVLRFIELQQRFADEEAKRPATAGTWALVAQSLMMSNEFQYID